MANRSAGACPPRTLDCADASEGQALALHEGAAFFFTVARGPVPRDRCTARETRAHARLACEGPSSTMKGNLLPPYCIETRRSLLP